MNELPNTDHNGLTNPVGGGDTKQYAWFVILLYPEFNVAYPRDSFSYRVYIEPSEWHDLCRLYGDAELGTAIGIEGIVEVYKTGAVPKGKAPDIIEKNCGVIFGKYAKGRAAIELKGVCVVADGFYEIHMMGTCVAPKPVDMCSITRHEHTEWSVSMPCEYNYNILTQIDPEMLEEPMDSIPHVPVIEHEAVDAEVVDIDDATTTQDSE